MPVFLEKYLIPIMVALTVLVIFTNPMNFDWTQRITGGLVLLFAAYFVAHTVHKSQQSRRHEASVPWRPVELPAVPQAKPQGAPDEERIFLPEDVDVEYLYDLYKGINALQSDTIVALYLGKWIHVSGTADQIVNSRDGPFVILRVPRKNRESHILVGLTFGEQWHSRLAVMRIGTKLTAIGRIASFSLDGPAISNCELVSK